MTPLLLAATNPATEIAERFGFNKQLFTTHLVGFAIVAFLLHRFAYKPLLEMLDQRRARIAEGMANAEKMKAELANAQAKSAELLAQAGTQANRIIEEARAAAAKVAEVETQKALAAAAEIVAKARQANDAELARMKLELRREVGRLVVAASVKVTGKILTLDDQQRLAEDTQRQLAA
jgi:F-type H+-transporting ATPase subunit b